MKFIEIRMTKQTIYLTEGELSKLLTSCPEIYMEGINRGKAFKRSSQLKERIKNHMTDNSN